MRWLLHFELFDLSPLRSQLFFGLDPDGCLGVDQNRICNLNVRKAGRRQRKIVYHDRVNYLEKCNLFVMDRCFLLTEAF